MANRPYVLSIAGLDPSGGAGLTSDLKTFEALKCYGLSVCTALTVQNDTEFKACQWTDITFITDQLEILLKRFPIGFVKIGIVENWTVVSKIVQLLKTHNPDVKIVLDPVLSASSNYTFHTSDGTLLEAFLKQLHLITPNYNEVSALYNTSDVSASINRMRKHTHVLLKGGHRPVQIGTDTLFTSSGETYHLPPQLATCSEKHGSGCVLSSAITSYLALGNSLEDACKKGKLYTEHFLSSNSTLLGYHYTT